MQLTFAIVLDFSIYFFIKVGALKKVPLGCKNHHGSRIASLSRAFAVTLLNRRGV